MPDRILLIDSEKDFADALAKRIQAEGTDVFVAYSPGIAMKKLDHITFGLIILNPMMPDNEGLDIIKKIKNRNDGTEMIILTGDTSVEFGINAMKLGTMNIVKKDPDIDVLLRKIDKVRARKILRLKRC